LGIDAGPCHRTPGDPSQGAADGVTADGAGCQINAEADGSTLVVNWVDGSLHGDHVGETFNAGKGHHRFCWFWALVGHVVRFMRVALQETIAGPGFCCLKLVNFCAYGQPSDICSTDFSSSKEVTMRGFPFWLGDAFLHTMGALDWEEKRATPPSIR